MPELDTAPLVDRFEMRSLADLRQMFDALERRDDASLWKAAKAAPSQAEFFEQLRDQVTTTTYEAGKPGAGKRGEKLRYHCCLTMVPVVLPHGSRGIIDDSKALKPAVQQLRAWLQEWFDHRVEVSIFNLVVGYAEVCVWSPSMMREKLDRLAVQKEPTLALPPDFEFNLPEGAPALGFLVGAIHRPLEWPRVPEADFDEDARFSTRVSGALQVCSQQACLQAPIVSPPDHAGEALVCGITTWLEEIHRSHGIGRWDLQPVDQDLVVLQLEVGDEATRTSPIPLRAHQIGLDGIERIVAVAARLGRGYLSPPQ